MNYDFMDQKLYRMENIWLMKISTIGNYKLSIGKQTIKKEVR